MSDQSWNSSKSPNSLYQGDQSGIYQHQYEGLAIAESYTIINPWARLVEYYQ